MSYKDRLSKAWNTRRERYPSRDLTDETINFWTVLKKLDKVGSNYRWLCRCACGTVKPVWENQLLNDGSKSCGCGLVKKWTKHGLSNDRFYKLWVGIKQRCYNPNNQAFSYYGGRGIEVSDVWKDDPEAFVGWCRNQPDNHLTLDRINNDGPYAPNNCRFITMAAQARNQRSDTCYCGCKHCCSKEVIA